MRTTSKSVLRALGVSACAGLLVAQSSRAEGLDDVLATYRSGTVTRSEVDDWRRFHRSKTGQPVRERHVRSVALLEIYELAAADTEILQTDRGRLLTEARHRALAVAALDATLNRAARPSEEELHNYWSDKKEEFRRPQRWKLENIFLARPPSDRLGEGKDRSAELEAIRQAILAGADFAEMVARYSESATRDRGGAMGWTLEDRLVSQVVSAIDGLSIGGLSSVIETERGWTLLRVVDHTPARAVGFDEARTRLRSRLVREHLGVISEKLDRELLDRATPIEVMPRISSSSPSTIAVSFQTEDGRALLTVDQVELFLEAEDPRTDPASLSPQEWAERCKALVVAESRAAEAARRGLTESDEFRNDLLWSRRHIAASLWVSAQVEGTLATPDEGDLRAHFEEFADEFAIAERSHMRLLEVALGNETPATVVGRAEELAPALQAGEMTFDEAAGRIDPSTTFVRVRDVGWLHEQDLFHLGFRLQPLAGDLAVGSRTPLVQQGPYLLMLESLAQQPARQPSFEEARDRVAAAVRARQVRRAQRALEERLLLEHEFTMIADAS